MTSIEPPESAKAAGLHYVSDAQPGLRRVKRSTGFGYLGVDGKPITDEATVARIRKLAIPPAYTDVWICADPRGHLQATGRDARGRKQYRYHPRWRDVRDETKFDRMIAFAGALPAIRAAVGRDLALPGLPREKVLATAISLLESTHIRVGNEEYAKGNDSYGLTTLHEEHVDVRGDRVRFKFRGKSGREHDVSVRDKRLARIVRQMRDLPGQELFRYIDDDGEPAAISSQDVNAYLRAIAGDDFTAKDFRTWEGTLACAVSLGAHESPAAKTHVVAAIKAVSERLGNTPAVCKKSYIHPGVIEEFLAKGALELVERAAHPTSPARDPHALRADERRVLALLERLNSNEGREKLGDLLATSVQRAKRKHRAA